MKNYLKYYGITFLAVSIVFVGIAACRGLFAANEAADIYAALSDGATVAGGLTLCVGLLIFVDKQGVFDGLSYNTGSFARQFIPGTGLLRPKQDYHDYVTEKQEKRKNRRMLHLILVGVFYLLIGIIFALLFIRTQA